MNVAILKSLKFWIAVVIAVLGVLVSQGVVLDGSLAEQVIGWIAQILGTAGAGHAVATAPTNDTI